MKKAIVITSCFFLFAILHSGCYYDKLEKLHPALGLGSNTLCDTSNITYSNSIVNIMSVNCYGCHDAANYKVNGGGYQLDSYSNLYAQYQSGIFPNNLTGTGGTKQMPPTGPIPDCEIAVINKWVSAGAPNN